MLMAFYKLILVAIKYHILGLVTLYALRSL